MLLLNVFRLCYIYFIAINHQDSFMNYAIEKQCANPQGSGCTVIYVNVNAIDGNGNRTHATSTYNGHTTHNKYLDHCNVGVFPLTQWNLSETGFCNHTIALHIELYDFVLILVKKCTSSVVLPYMSTLKAVVILVHVTPLERFDYNRTYVVIPISSKPGKGTTCSIFGSKRIGYLGNYNNYTKLKQQLYQHILPPSNQASLSSSAVLGCYNWRKHVQVHQNIIQFQSCLNGNLGLNFCNGSFTNCKDFLPISVSTTFLKLSKRFTLMTYGAALTQIRFDVFVPQRNTNKDFISIWRLLSPFSTQVWLTFSSLLICVLLIVRRISKIDLIWVFAVILEKECSQNHKVSVNTISVVITWIFAMFILRNMYTSYMVSSLTKDIPPNNVPKTFDGLISQSEACVVAETQHWVELYKIGFVSPEMINEFIEPELGNKTVPRFWRLEKLLYTLAKKWFRLQESKSDSKIKGLEQLILSLLPNKRIALIYSVPNLNLEMPYGNFPINSRAISLLLPSFTYIETRHPTLGTSCTLWVARKTILTELINLYMGKFVESGLYTYIYQTSHTLTTLYTLKNSMQLNQIENKWNFLIIAEYVAKDRQIDAALGSFQIDSEQGPADVLIVLQDLSVAFFVTFCSLILSALVLLFERRWVS